MKKLSLLISAILVFTSCNLALAQNGAETIEVKSACVENGSSKAVVVLPSDYDKNPDARYPVVYLLHGHGDTEQKWFKEKPELVKLATQYQLIVVCPNGKFSWYWDSVVKPEIKYETYVSKDLVKEIDSKYRTKASPKFRAITGLSMGGHGGLWLGLRHPEIFGACGSMSGGVDIRPFPKNWHMADSLGKYEDNKDVWDKHTVINLVENLKPNQSKIVFECGVADFFYKVNEDLHKKLLAHKIPHDYTTRPGTHSWSYWKNAIEYQMLFFNNFFQSNNK